MARRTKDEAEKTRARILAVAVALFVRNGYDRTTLNDIAAKLKLTKGAVYWHFQSKEKLLVAIVDEMLLRFARELEALMPREGLTYRAVVEAMVANAKMIAEHPSARANYLFMKTQVKWGTESMKGVREELLTNNRFGPFHAFETAISNDIGKGLVRKGVDSAEVASVCIALWDGLVQAHVDKFLRKDLETVLRHAFDAVWISIKKEVKNGRSEEE